eukprot:g3123.t1
MSTKTPERIERINPEIFTLTYGALVMQLIKDYEKIAEVNEKLKEIGFNIGVRLIDEFLAKSGTMRCKSFKETVQTIAKVAFKMYLGFTADIHTWNKEGTACIMTIPDNALTDFVELPEKFRKLSYCEMLCGVIQGALKMIDVEVECEFTKEKLHGDATTEMKITLKSEFSRGG